MWITPKNARGYGFCENCDYISHNKYDFKRHLLTTKHKMDNKKNASLSQDGNVGGFYCECGKKYKYRSGLCKHKHKCRILTTKDSAKKNCEAVGSVETNTNLTKDMFNQFMKQQHFNQ